MSEVPPFGFGPPAGDDDESRRRGGSGADNPLAGFLGSMNPSDLGAAFQRLGQMLSHQGSDPVNWDLAREVARQTVSEGRDRSVTGKEQAQIEEATRLAELWLDPVTNVPAATSGASAWSRAEWVEATLPVWKQLVEPIAGRVVAAMGDVLPGEMAPMAGPFLGLMRTMGGAMFGAQVGQALGSLAGEVVGSTDVGLPLNPAGRVALLPQNISAFGSGLGLPDDEVRVYLALREAAHQRLFAHVSWLRTHLLGAVEGYARGINVDTQRLEQAIGQLDPNNPEALQEALSSGMFEPEQTPGQKAALARLETILALVEGWVDTVVDEAAAQRLPSAAALRESVRRRRAAGGPAEQTFATLVGLELRPRRLREAARLWTALGEARGGEGRDAVWAHPDLLPSTEDLDDPEAFVHRTELDLPALDDAAPDEGAPGEGAPGEGDGPRPGEGG
ncbi:MAG: zinc-dependent metalloprotease [Streptomycetales bacterium]